MGNYHSKLWIYSIHFRHSLQQYQKNKKDNKIARQVVKEQQKQHGKSEMKVKNDEKT
jgi:hypothetical protein